MIGRSAVGAPWRVGAIARALETGEPLRAPPREIQLRDASEHLESLIAQMGAHQGLRHARKHLAAYAEEVGASRDLRRALVTADEPSQARALLARCFEDCEFRAAA
jgi:tRNA-dihydrouridine synthase